MLNKHTLKTGINWWTEGLSYLCPASMRKLFKPAPEFITLEFKGQQVSCNRYTDDSNEAIETRHFNPEDDVVRDSVLNWLQEHSQHKSEITLVIPDECFLTRKMTFPKATSSNLRQVLSFEMNRKTPFTPEQTYFDYLLINPNSQLDKVQLELILVPRERVDSYLELLTSWNIKLNAIRPAIHHNNKQLNLIAPEDRPQTDTASDKNMLILTATTCLLLVAVLYAPILNQEKQLALLETKVAKSRKTVIQLQALKQNKEKLFKQSRFLDNKRTNETSTIKLIDEVTKIIPDDTWLTRLIMKSGELQLQGESSHASSLIQILESSDYFAEVQFRSPVTQNRTTNKDKFHLSAQLARGES